MEVKETPKCYVGAGSRIDKEKVMRLVQNQFSFNGYNRIEFETYCLDEQLEEAKAMLKKKILDTFEARIPVMDAMRRHFDMNRADSPESIVNNTPETHSMNVL
jgi:hypothetical protein